MSLPLKHIKVVDFCQVYAGPVTTMLLADQGAEVIKVEPPTGDSSRDITPIPDTKDLSPGYLAVNRNKRTVMVDIHNPKGLEVVHRLVRWADVVVCNMRGSVPHRLGIAYEDLAPINPRLIYASMTAYGERGPGAALPGYDVVIQSKSATTVLRRMADGTPVPTTIFYNDMSGAMLTAYAIMLALRERESTGKGQKIEVNLLHTSLALQAVRMIKFPGISQESLGPAPTELTTHYICGDGKYIDIKPTTEQHWPTLWRLLELDELDEDPQFATHASRVENAQAIYDILSNLFIARTAAEWEVALKEINATAVVVNESEAVFEDPQVVANGMFGQFEHPGLGLVTAVAPPIRFSGSADEPRFRRPAPEFGEHNVEVLREMGYSPDEIEALQKEGVLVEGR